jgi:hypothetical protein
MKTQLSPHKTRMVNMRKTIAGACNIPNRARLIAGFALAILLAQHAATGAEAPVNLGAAGNYVILAETEITTTGTTSIVGDLGVSPVAASYITGFSLIMDSSGQFSTSSLVTGKIFAADYLSPTPGNLTAAVNDMQTAYTDAAGRTSPDYTELGSGYIGGMTLAPGLYKWSTDVTISSDVTISGGPNDVWIFQISGNLSLANATKITLSGGAQARNIFWQIAGGSGATLATTSQFEGIILTKTAVVVQTGSSITGRMLAQSAVTIDGNAVTVPPSPPIFGPISRAASGIVTLVVTNTPYLQLTLQYSTNLTSWTILSTPTPTTSPYVITDATTSSDTMRFYRAFYP